MEIIISYLYHFQNNLKVAFNTINQNYFILNVSFRLSKYSIYVDYYFLINPVYIFKCY